MFSRFSVSVIIILAAMIWGGALSALKIELTWTHALPFSFTVFLLTLGLSLYNKYLWRFRPFHWFAKTPDIQGTWLVEICSTYKNSKSRKPNKPLVGYAAIRQTYSSLSIRVMTKDSTSKLIAHSINISSDNHVEIVGAYQSDPAIHLRGDESEIHYGAFKLSISGIPPSLIEGHYWTDRNTCGGIRYLKRNKIIADHFEMAEQLFIPNIKRELNNDKPTHG